MSAFDVLAPANRLIEDEQFVYEYNPDGNLIRKGIKADGKEWRYGYDIYDRLISAGLYASAGAFTPEKLKTYVYDAFDRRVSAFDETAGGLSSATPARHTLHDEWNVLVQQESPQGSGGPAAGQSRRWFTQGGEDDIAAITPSASGTLDPGTSSIYASTDHLGSVRALHDDSGTIVADLDHDTFGNREIAVESFAQPFGYTGREYDADTGLYHYRAREYDPVAGRFLQEDPIWYASGDMNVYRYVLSNPVRYRDPLGESAAKEYGITGAGSASLSAGQAKLAWELNCVFGGIAATLHVINDSAKYGFNQQLGFSRTRCGAVVNQVGRRVKEVKRRAESYCRTQTTKRGYKVEKLVEEVLEVLYEKTELETHAYFDVGKKVLITDATLNQETHLEVKTYVKTKRIDLHRRDQSGRYEKKGGGIMMDFCSKVRSRR